MSDCWTTEKGLLPNIIREQKAARKRPVAIVISPTGISEEISATDLDNASNRAAWFIHENVPEEEQSFYYIGPSDIVYLIWALGAMKTGKVVICPSPANTIAANQLLFRDVQAHTLFHPPEDFDLLLAPLHAATKTTLKWIQTPSHRELMSKNVVEEYPFTHTFDEICNKPFLGLHTSGTTGHPKPVYWTHAITPIFAAQGDASLLPENHSHPPLMQEIWENEACFTPFPLYHAAGYLGVFSSIMHHGTWVIPARGVQLTPENVTAMVQHTKASGLFCPPSILEAMLKHPQSHAFLASGQLKHIVYGGGPMSKHAGDQLASLCPHVVNTIGSTEGGHALLMREDSGGSDSRWDAMKFVPLGQRMEEVEPGLSELVWPRTELTMRTTMFFHSMPHLKVEYRTKDLFENVGDGWWKYRGRTDNWVAMANGLKMDPKEMEETIGAHPSVVSVLLAGDKRFRLCLLIELNPEVTPSPGAEESTAAEWEKEMLEDLWPTIERANQAAPKFGKVPKELVLFAKNDKSFLRSAKGSVQRRLTLSAYEAEIDDMYARAEHGLLMNGLPDLKSTSTADLVPFLTELYSQTLGCDEIAPEEDLFSKGLDSFAVASLTSRLKAALRKYGVADDKLQSVGITLMYKGTTLLRMAETLGGMLCATNGHKRCTEPDDVLGLLDRYEHQVQNTIGKHNIVLTGSTGSLGSYLLAELLARSDVNKVVCLNRTSDAKTRQIAALESRGLPSLQAEYDSGRVIFLESSLAAPNLGLSNETYDLLLQETTCIIHNAFPVNFLLSLRSFEPQLRGQLNLLSFVHECIRRPSFLFISSIGAAMRTTDSSALVREEIFPRHDAADLLEQGYSQAKFISERMVNTYATMTSNRKMAVLRVGQVAGPLVGAGVWNTREWLPSLVHSSKFLGAVPATIGQSVDWIPVDAVARIVSEIMDDVNRNGEGTARGGGSQGAVVYNVVNPEPTTWQSLLPALTDIAPETVSIEEWLWRLEKSISSSAYLLDQHPGVKLLDFFKGFLQTKKGNMRFATDNLVSASATAAKLEAIKLEDMQRWLKTWRL